MDASTDIQALPAARVRAVRAVEYDYLHMLIAWSVGSVAGGVGGWLVTLAAERSSAAIVLDAVAWQFIIWGGIDLALAVNGVRGWQKRRHLADDAPEHVQHARKLVDVLNFNHFLNLGYVLIGLALLIAAWLVAQAELATTLLGHGLGVLVQGGFLKYFDARFCRALRTALSPSGLSPTSDLPAR